MAVTPRTRVGFIKVRRAERGSRMALVAPASPFDRAQFDAGVSELRRIGFEPVYDDRVFDRHGFVAGQPSSRAQALQDAWASDVGAILAVRGGYGSVETLPLLNADRIREARTAFIGYSDVTSIHAFLGATVGLVSIHGPMIEGRLAAGAAAYDASSFLTALSGEPLGELTAPRLEVIRPGEARGALVGGTLTQLLASLSTPYEFRPPAGHVLFLDEVGERPYRLHRMLTQWRLSGRLRDAAAIVFGELPRCDEPGGAATAGAVIAGVLADFPGPVLLGFPSGHTTSPLVTLPFGVEARVVATGSAPRLVIEEAAAGD
jgi:muramoyltetrapeptide carboxypeptidase